MSAANVPTPNALGNLERLGFRLKVYALVLPLCVALAVTLQVGFQIAVGTVAIIGAVTAVLLLLLVPAAYGWSLHAGQWLARRSPLWNAWNAQAWDAEAWDAQFQCELRRVPSDEGVIDYHERIKLPKDVTERIQTRWAEFLEEDVKRAYLPEPSEPPADPVLQKQLYHIALTAQKLLRTHCYPPLEVIDILARLNQSRKARDMVYAQALRDVARYLELEIYSHAVDHMKSDPNVSEMQAHALRILQRLEAERYQDTNR